jgi:hypothetical protein
MPVEGNTQLAIDFMAAPGMGNAWFGVYLNADYCGWVYAVEGVTASINVTIPPARGANLSVVVLRQGSMQAYDQSRAARGYDGESAAQATLTVAWPAEILGTPENANLSAWTLAGLTYALADRGETKTRGAFTINLTVTGGTATLALANGGGTLASGSVAVPGTITLAEQNNSGLSGTVAIGAGAATWGGLLYLRWPASLEIYRAAANPPTVLIDTETFAGYDTTVYTDPALLAAGTYYYRTRFVSDTGESGAYGAAQAEVIPGLPGAPGTLAYLSGTAAATILSFTASATVGATYRAYTMGIGGSFIDVDNIAATAAAGATQITLPALSGYPGTAQAIVRAVYGGVEEKNGAAVSLEYDAAGAYVPARPSAPGVKGFSVSAGLTLNVTGTYSRGSDLGVATQLQLFTRAPGGSYNYSSPDATAALAAAGSMQTAALAATLTDGWWYFVLKSATAAGVQSAAASAEYLALIADDVLSAPSVAYALNRG